MFQRVFPLNREQDVTYLPSQKIKRSACPALNILANEGLISKTGKDIRDVDLVDALYETYGLQKFISRSLIKTTKKKCGIADDDTFDLDEISIHSGPEHDASLFHRDSFNEPNQTRIDKDLVRKFIASTDDEYITWSDLMKFKRERIESSKAMNPTYSYTFTDQLVSYGEMLLLMTMLGRNGKISKSDLETMLIQGRLPPDYERSSGFSVFNFFWYIRGLFLN